jgi:hypothetical protein
MCEKEKRKFNKERKGMKKWEKFFMSHIQRNATLSIYSHNLQPSVITLISVVKIHIPTLDFYYASHDDEKIKLCGVKTNKQKEEFL